MTPAGINSFQAIRVFVLSVSKQVEGIDLLNARSA
jgi:hypothetical protein